MGGAASTAVAVPLLREVRQNIILPYYSLKNLKDIDDLVFLI